MKKRIWQVKLTERVVRFNLKKLKFSIQIIKLFQHPLIITFCINSPNGYAKRLNKLIFTVHWLSDCVNTNSDPRTTK